MSGLSAVATYEQQEVHGTLLDSLSDESSGLRIQVQRKGAELVGLAAREASLGYLYRDGDPRPAAAGWNNHATVMGFFVHRLKEGSSLYRGAKLQGGTHSLIRHKLFGAPRVESDSLTYCLDPDQIAPEEYPLRVAFSISYALREGGLEVSFAFENQEPEKTAHVSFGLHPGFAITSWESARVLLPAGKYVRHLAPDNLLSGETKSFEFGGGRMPFDYRELPESFLLEPREVASRIVTVVDPEAGRQVEIDLGSAPYLTLWSDGGPFICVEPCWGMPDHHLQRPFEQKLGIQEILPGAKLERSFRIVPGVL